MKGAPAMLFIDNKYTRWYYNLINRASNRSLDGYKEIHHIIPRSIGGKNTKDNLVALTAKEHFICHLLLLRMLTGQDKAKMVYACWQLANQENSNQDRVKINSLTYAKLREEFSKTHSTWMKNNRDLIQKKVDAYWTDENRRIHAEKISKVTKGRIVSNETKEKLRNKTWTNKALQSRQDNCLKNAAARKDKPWSEAMRTSREDTYYNKNKDLANSVFEIMKTESSINAIAKTLTVDWNTVKNIIDRQEGFNNRFGLPK